MPRSIASLFVVGLALVFVAFLMLDRAWWQVLPPWGPVRHPAAAVVGGSGLVLCLGAARWRRAWLRDRGWDG